jgi:hypothetical protein
MKAHTPGTVAAAAIITALALVALLDGCTAAQQQTALATPSGQLFCAIQTTGGGALVVALADASVAAASPGAAPLAIIATNASKAFVDAACAAAAKPGEVSVPVAPPTGPAVVPIVAVVPPAKAPA